MICIPKDKKSKTFTPQQLSQEQPSPWAPENRRILLLKELFLDDTHYDSEKLEIHWVPGNRIIINSEERSIF